MIMNDIDWIIHDNTVWIINFDSSQEPSGLLRKLHLLAFPCSPHVCTHAHSGQPRRLGAAQVVPVSCELVRLGFSTLARREFSTL